jgi:prevent-host-death family protein
MARRRKTAVEELAVSDLKARCSEVIEQVARDGREFVITRRGQRVARLVAAGVERRSPRGSWKGLVEVRGDIVTVDWTDEFEAARE